MSQSDRLLLGVIAGPRGIKGELKVKSFTENPEDIASYGPLENKAGDQKFEIKLVGVSKNLPIIRMKGVSDRNKAEAMKGQELYISREKLPETLEDDEFYHADLVGLDVIFEDGTNYGQILRLHDFGGGDIVEIKPDGKGAKASVLVPFTKDLVPTVDMTKGHIVVDLPDDFFDTPPKEPLEEPEGKS